MSSYELTKEEIRQKFAQLTPDAAEPVDPETQKKRNQAMKTIASVMRTMADEIESGDLELDPNKIDKLIPTGSTALNFPYETWSITFPAEVMNLIYRACDNLGLDPKGVIIRAIREWAENHPEAFQKPQNPDWSDN